MDVFLFDKISVMRLHQRCLREGEDRIYFRLSDGSDVLLTIDEWDELGRRFREAIAPSAKALRAAIFLAIPFAIAVLALLGALPGAIGLLDRLNSAVPGVLPLLLFSGLPLAAMAGHMTRVQAAIDRTEAMLALRPRCWAPSRPPRKLLNGVEILGLVFIGPYVLIQLYGTLFPDAFRNTPWTGMKLNAAGVAAIIVLLVLAALRWSERRRSIRPTGDHPRPLISGPAGLSAHRTPPGGVRARSFGRKSA